MKKKKLNKKIIIALVIIAILLLILLSQSIIKSQNKRKLALSENTPNEAILAEPNIPVISAGMIPVKMDGGNLVITTKEDTNWYDYKNGKPAYIMLNDGYYKSELERGVKEEQLMQNNVGVGVPDDSSIRGTIFMWVPRFAYRTNEKSETEIGYIKEGTTPRRRLGNTIYIYD